MPQAYRPTASRALVFLSAVACAAVFAVATNHAWEDYYITYRSSRNLANGHGLVFNVGDRLHTFTSPLGVLLPAVARLLTFNSSDTGALWIFRAMSCLAFGGAMVLLHQLAQKQRLQWAASVFVVAWMITDPKSVDFTINGMETGFMLLFLAYALWSLATPTAERRWLHLGAAWGGLMWTRPDSFIYIGLLALGAWLFNSAADSGVNRRTLAVLLLRSAALCAMIYLPWFITAWIYYGSPVPHTIVAKASVGVGTKTALGALWNAVQLPVAAWRGPTTLEATFLPSYYVVGGWPSAIVLVARVAGWLAAIVWLIPAVNFRARVASFVYFGANAYLSYYPYFPFPWYLPPATLLACVALAGALSDVLDAGRAGVGALPRLARQIAIAAAALLLATQAWSLVAVGRQVRQFQSIIEDNNRRKIGEWLAQHAEPGDRVFLEPLGYIGFYSGLKTYDWPGLSSTEVVEAHRRLGGKWSSLVDYLNPDWLVLRPSEAKTMSAENPEIFPAMYEPVKVFDVSDRVARTDVRGKRLLEADARFTIYHRQRPRTLLAEVGELDTRYPGPLTTSVIDHTTMRLVHAPGSLTIRIPRQAATVRVGYVIAPDAYAAEPKTTGAGFIVEWCEGADQKVLLNRTLDPVRNPADRPVQFFECALPAAATDEAYLVLRTLPGETDTKDWTCWSIPQFR